MNRSLLLLTQHSLPQPLPISYFLFSQKAMALSDDLPLQLTKDVKRQNRNRKTRTVRSKDFETLIRIATRAAHVASHKRHHTVTPEAIRCEA
ncbi:hypothetical protein YC2023_110124 [Brassica napus]